MANTLFLIRHDVMTSLRRSRSQIYSDFEALVSDLRTFPSGLTPNIRAACIFIAGYDRALHGVPLLGLYHWLVVRDSGDKRPRHWIQNLERMARQKAGSAASTQSVLENGCKILERFLAYRRRYGVRTVIAQAMEIRKRQIERNHQERGAARKPKGKSRMASNTSLERTRGG